MRKESIGIALAGLGTVGKGFVRLLNERRKDLESQLGVKLKLRWISDRHPKHKLKGLKLNGTKITTRMSDIVNDPEVDIVIELIGGLNDARKLTLESLKFKKHVITANKLLVSSCWEELLGAAHQNGCSIFYEAAVASGIPIIRSIREGLISSRISEIRGIMNGTTNYILTRMIHDQMGFKEALKLAQKKGFAEANPKLDINGTDTAHKIAILASLVSNRWVSPKDVYKEGIEDIELEDVRFAQDQLNLTVRLIGIFESNAKDISVRVHPCLLPVDHPFATVHNEYNAIRLSTDAAGDLYFHGKGAGSKPTASAVLSDLADLSRWILSQAPSQSGRNHNHEVKMRHMRDVEHAYYLRLWAKDKAGVLSRTTGIFGKHSISIAQIFQGKSTGFKASKKGMPVIVVTHPGSEQAMQKVIGELRKFKETEIAALLRIDYRSPE